MPQSWGLAGWCANGTTTGGGSKGTTRTTPSTLKVVSIEGHGLETKQIFFGLLEGPSIMLVFAAILFGFFTSKKTISMRTKIY